MYVMSYTFYMLCSYCRMQLVTAAQMMYVRARRNTMGRAGAYRQADWGKYACSNTKAIRTHVVYVHTSMPDMWGTKCKKYR